MGQRVIEPLLVLVELRPDDGDLRQRAGRGEWKVVAERGAARRIAELRQPLLAGAGRGIAPCLGVVE